ncbi:MAG: polyprenyl synthetase family protein [Methanoregula sp.]|jgi:geranylgeranyl diphosphate synthase type I
MADDTEFPQGHNPRNESTPGTIRVSSETRDVIIGEAVHPENQMEWWFVHGSFQGTAIGHQHFMMSIFRFDLSKAGTEPDDNYYVLLSVLDQATGEHTLVSRAEYRIIDRLCDYARELKSTGLHQALVETYIEELRNYGPPAPIRLEEEKPVLERDPFSFSWKDLSFRTTDTGIHLSFGTAGSDEECRFHLKPQSSRYTMENIGSIPGRSMTYATRPRLSLSGHMGDDPVTGTAWFDHQWGNTGWFLTGPDGGDLAGWDWAGINGADGSDWIFLTFRNPKSGDILNRFAARFGEDGEVRTFTHFVVRPVRFWTSERTHIRYPVAQEIEIPEISARFVVEPVTDKQEIPVLGPMRAIWEGAAVVTGSIGNSAFSGTARLELQGYGYIFDFQHYIGNHVNRIQKCIESFLPADPGDEDFMRFVGAPFGSHDMTACNETIIRPSWDLLCRERKNWRPVFGMLLLETLGISSEKYEMLLSVVPELTHTGTLIIDDIEDGANIRRGDTCIHLRYGTDVAINAANTLYFLPSVLYSTHPDLTDTQRLEFYRITHNSFIRGHFGQAQDIYWTKNLNEKNLAAWTDNKMAEKILQMYEFKTASAAIATAEAGCILAGTTSETRQACVAYARALGIAFQITDDIQSFLPDPGSGDMPGDDLAAGKLTYVIIRALELLDNPDRLRLRQILCSEHLRQDSQTMNEGIALVRKSGSLAECRTEALGMAERAWRDFSRIVPPSEPKVMLRLFSQNLLDHPGNG